MTMRNTAVAVASRRHVFKLVIMPSIFFPAEVRWPPSANDVSTASTAVQGVVAGRRPGSAGRNGCFLELFDRHVGAAEEHERRDRADGGERDQRSESPAVAGRERLRGEVPGLRMRDEDRRGDGDADGTADLLGRVEQSGCETGLVGRDAEDRKSTRLNSSHVK